MVEHIKLRSLSPFMCRDYTVRGRTPNFVGPHRAADAHETLHKALKQAVGWSLLPETDTPPKLTRYGRKKIRPLSERQARELISVVAEDRLEALYSLAVSTGLRQGELLGLRWMKHAGLPRMRFHDLRHTCAMLLLTQNVNPKILQEMLGHANISETMDTYSHVLPDMQESAVSAMEKALTKGSLVENAEDPRISPDVSPVTVKRPSAKI